MDISRTTRSRAEKKFEWTSKFNFSLATTWILGSFSNDDSDGNERHNQKSNRFIKQNNNFVHVSHFFVHFFAVTTWLLRETA